MSVTQVGAYRLLQQIGAGGMGAVWLAEHAMLGRRAAVKLLHPDYSSRSEMVSRFFNEARAASTISDPGIVQIFDYGRQDGTAYIVMELLDGEGLDKRLRAHGPMQPNDALRIIRQVASSLGAAHARGIVHRDLKPENIFLVPDPEVAGGERAKILDFGIAKLQGDVSGWRTSTSTVMGTPLYMSPEQCRGAGQVDQRADIYSIGCMLFMLLTGRPPFLAEGSGDLIAMHLREAPPLASQYSVRVTPEIDQLIARCLAKDPAQRYASGKDLAQAISLLLGSMSNVGRQSASALPPPAPLVPMSATTLSSSTGVVVAAPTPSPAKQHKSKAPIIAIATAAVVIGGIVVFAVTRPGPEKQVSAQAPAPPPPVVQADAAVVEPPPPDVRVVLAEKMRRVGTEFLKWAAKHQGAPCPTAKDLEASIKGGAATLQDNWGTPLTITCTDQPAGQIIGLISAGPDKVAGNRDDIASWTLGPDLTDTIAGDRWTVAEKKPATRTPPSRPSTRTGSTSRTGSATTQPVTRPTTTTNDDPIDVDGDGLPDVRVPSKAAK